MRKDAGPSSRQLGALALTAAGVPIFRLCCRVSWLWVLLGGLAAAGTLSALTAAVNCRRARRKGACPRSGTNLPIAHKAFPLRGRWPEGPDEVVSDQCNSLCFSPVSVLFAVLLLAAALYAAWETTFAFPETAGNLPAAALVLGLAAAAARRGPAAAGRCAGILLRITGALYGAVLLFSLPQIRGEWLRPSGSPAEALRVWAALLIPGAAILLSGEPEEGRGMPCWPWWTAAISAAAAAAVTGGILSPALAREPEAFRTLSQGVSVLGVIRRFEALVNGAMLMSGFCLCTLYLTAAKNILKNTKKVLTNRSLGAIIAGRVGERNADLLEVKKKFRKTENIS